LPSRRKFLHILLASVTILQAETAIILLPEIKSDYSKNNSFHQLSSVESIPASSH
jgi:hypothetical protein